MLLKLRSYSGDAPEKARPVATTVVAWPTTQQGPVAGEPVPVWLFGPLPAREQLSPFRSVNCANDVPVVGLRMKSNCVTSVSFPGSNTPSASGHCRSASFHVI